MSHQRYPSSAQDGVKEPHSISLKVLRLSRPALVTQYPIPSPSLPGPTAVPDSSEPIPASLAYKSSPSNNYNPEPFVLSPILNLPPSFGSAYVGETFSCTLCANHEIPDGGGGSARKNIRGVRIDAEMKTPGSAVPVKLGLSAGGTSASQEDGTGTGASLGVDLKPGQTLQRVVSFDLKEEGNHVLAVTVSYYEASETSGRTRTFRKLYQFICKASLIVRTKAGALETPTERFNVGGPTAGIREGAKRSRWVLEAQLENCSEDTMQLERVALDLEPGLTYTDCNWEASGSQRPVLHPGEVEQVCFVIREEQEQDEKGEHQGQIPGHNRIRIEDGRVIFGSLGIGWRSEMGNRGYLSTGKLGTRYTG